MKHSTTYYYVQAQKEGKSPEILYHSRDKKTNEYFYKFMDKKKAKALAESEKKLIPEDNFRVVKCIETFEAGEWV
jgi:excinuclease UvrABC nuclease subunit